MNYLQHMACRTLWVIACLMAGLLGGCSKSADPDIKEWGNYEGQYPRSGALEASAKAQQAWTPLFHTARVQQELGRLLPPDVLEEFTALSVEAPIEQPEVGFLYAYVCEAHNCPHSAEVVIDIQNKKFAVIMYRIDESKDRAIATCYSNHIKSLGEFPARVLASLSLANIAAVTPELSLETFSCIEKN